MIEDDETNMVELEAAVRGIGKDGLVWGASKLVPVGFGIKKLQLVVVVEDDKISTQDLQDEIEAFEDYVQSSDIVSHPLFIVWLGIIEEDPTNSWSRFHFRNYSKW